MKTHFVHSVDAMTSCPRCWADLRDPDSVIVTFFDDAGETKLASGCIKTADGLLCIGSKERWPGEIQEVLYAECGACTFNFKGYRL